VKEGRKVVPSNNSILSLQAIEIPTSAVDSSAAGKAVKSLANNLSSNINSSTSVISKSVTSSSSGSGSSADEFKIDSSADSSASSLVYHRPADYAWAAMDVWHMECALHHARSAAAEDEVPVRRGLPHETIERNALLLCCSCILAFFASNIYVLPAMQTYERAHDFHTFAWLYLCLIFFESCRLAPC
jgi:hypothetical protein